VTLTAWQDDFWRTLPVYRVDIQGLNEQPMNIQWAGSLSHLQEILTRQGWLQAPELGPSSIMNWLAPEPDIAHLPILPQVHDGQHHELLLDHQNGPADKLTVLRLWPANVEISPDATSLWIGTVSYLTIDQSLYLISSLKTAMDFDGPLAALQEVLAQDVNIRTVQRDVSLKPHTGWDGKVLLMWEQGMGGEKQALKRLRVGTGSWHQRTP
ncbi:MAG: LssY C-terminal domain-containing protein, partial [Pseudomonadota bacterium]|nr:LssY C-terminal domain-containing protein [Pseudomonadota bacterium]